MGFDKPLLGMGHEDVLFSDFFFFFGGIWV
jgi:hypothetical protein